jgi:hypothetical protein
MASKKSGERAVVICTDKRGVFFGYSDDTSGDTVTLKRARMCVYWDVATKGVMGLAAGGPTKDCKVTAAVPVAELRGITCVLDCSDDARGRWEEGPWQ